MPYCYYFCIIYPTPAELVNLVTSNIGKPEISFTANNDPNDKLSVTVNRSPSDPITLNTVEPDPITSRACAPEAEMIADPVILAVPVNGKASDDGKFVSPEPSPWNEPEKFGAEAVLKNIMSPVLNEPEIRSAVSYTHLTLPTKA